MGRQIGKPMHTMMRVQVIPRLRLGHSVKVPADISEDSAPG